MQTSLQHCLKLKKILYDDVLLLVAIKFSDMSYLFRHLDHIKVRIVTFGLTCCPYKHLARQKATIHKIIQPHDGQLTLRMSLGWQLN